MLKFAYPNAQTILSASLQRKIVLFSKFKAIKFLFIITIFQITIFTYQFYTQKIYEIWNAFILKLYFFSQTLKFF
jgi:hypothetical protein